MQKISPSYVYVALLNIAIGLFGLANVFLKPEIPKVFFTFSAMAFWLPLIGSIFLLAMGLVQIITKRTYGFKSNPKISYELMYFGLAGLVTGLFALSFVSKQSNLISSALFLVSILMLVFLGYKLRSTSQKQ